MLLVIGVTGHTGRYFLEELKKNKYHDKVRFLVRKNSDMSILKECDLDYEIIYGDLNNKEDIKKACRNIETILEIYNIKHSLDVLDSAIEQGVKRVIFVHTTGIYSKYKMASSEYKDIEEKVIEKAKGKINITILRPTMIYGDICDHNISKFIKMIDKMRIYPLIAGGKAKIQPVNAKDLGKAYYEVLINEENTKNKDYNLSGGTEIEIKEMLKLISNKLNKKTIFITLPMWMSIMATYILKFISLGKINIVEKVLRMNETRVFSYEKAAKDFGYNPSSFEEGLAREIKQYKNKKNIVEKKKKALISTTVPSTIEQFNMANIKLLQNLGYNVSVISNFNVTGNIDQERLNDFIEELKEMDVEIHSVDFSRSPLNVSNIKAYKQIKKIINNENYDLIHCHTPICGAITRLVSRKARKNGTKMIYTAHGFHFYKGAPLLNWIIYYPIEKIMARYTDCLITINEEDYKFAKKHLKAKKIELVHGVGINENKFEFEMTEKEKIEYRKSLNLKKEDFIITYVAELNKNKNQIMLINAIKDLLKENKYKNIKVLLIGKGEYLDLLKKEISSNNLESNIFILGYRKDVAKLLKITDLYVSTSIREGLPVNIMEAMYMGLPIVATDNRGHRELVLNNESGYIVKDFNNSDLMADKIKELISDKMRMKEFGNKGKELSKKYKTKCVLEEMKKIYQNYERENNICVV